VLSANRAQIQKRSESVAPRVRLVNCDGSYLTILSRSRRCCPSPAAAAAGAGSRRPWAAAPRRPVAARRRPAEGTPAGPAEGNPCPAAGKLQIRAKNETQTDQYRATNSSSEFRVR
jgi:hypothetical protein